MSEGRGLKGTGVWGEPRSWALGKSFETSKTNCKSHAWSEFGVKNGVILFIKQDDKVGLLSLAGEAMGKICRRSFAGVSHVHRRVGLNSNCVLGKSFETATKKTRECHAWSEFGVKRRVTYRTLNVR